MQPAERATEAGWEIGAAGFEEVKTDAGEARAELMGSRGSRERAFLKFIVSYLSSYENFFSAAGGRRRIKLDRKAGSGIVKGSKSFLFYQ